MLLFDSFVDTIPIHSLHYRICNMDISLFHQNQIQTTIVANRPIRSIVTLKSLTNHI